jgi:hypothetical protein
MTGWTTDELANVDAADELEITWLRPDGTLRDEPHTAIDLFLRHREP